MRISDWSSDVCSSDLIPGLKNAQTAMATSGADDKMLIHFDAIMGSMTPKERAKPDLINAKRKIRIANGSGTTEQQVNKVLKMHQEMSTAMKRIRKMGALKGLRALFGRGGGIDRKSTRLNSNHYCASRMPSS